MPYSIDQKNKCVYKKKADGTRGQKVGCTKGDLQDYISALKVNVDEKKKVLNEIKQVLKENENIQEAPVQLANNIEFYVVEKSKDPMDDPMNLSFKTDPIGFANQVRGGLLPEDIHGFYLDENEAMNAAHDLVQAVYETARGLEEKKGKVTEKIHKKIAHIQKEVNAHLKAAKSDPVNAENYEAQVEALLSQIKELRAKHSIIEKSKKPLQEKEVEKKKLNEDHEVSMAQGSLETIIRHANELLAKLGNQEKDIPGWIQDHISKSENYIQQANDQYHEYGPEQSKVLPEAGKDFDKDGEIEKPSEEYKGVKDKAIKQAMQKQK
jgi:DNA repair exonuclease SbcCD ATPase subunit